LSSNKAVVYLQPGKAVEETPFPKLELQDGPGVNPANVGRKTPHGVILEVLATNICGSDQHMVRGRTSAPSGLVLGHEILGKVIETGPDVEFVRIGDICSVPFNIACGRCRNCKEAKTGICLNVNPDRPGSAYGYVDMGGWVGGQAQFVLVPYADWNLLVFPDPDQAMEKIRDLTMLSDIFPTGFHGALTAGVKPGSTVYVAGAGPVGPPPIRRNSSALPSSSWVTSMSTVSGRLAALDARRSTCPRGTHKTKSWTSSGFPRSTARSTRSVSRPTPTDRPQHRKRRRP
jgi:glutathione-independent formaldehyde dehydrogenase